MAVILEAITHIWHHGRMVEPGEFFSADETFAKKLIEGNSAKISQLPNDNEEQIGQVKQRRVSKKVEKNE